VRGTMSDEQIPAVMIYLAMKEVEKRLSKSKAF
jgi:hypothetical protein